MARRGSSDGEEEEEEEGEETMESPETEKETVADGLTDYEKERLQVIQRNRRVLASLQIKNLATSLQPVGSPVENKEKSGPSIGVRRRSQRLSAIKGTPSKVVVDWNSSSSELRSESESDGPSFFSKRKTHGKKTASLTELEVLEKKKEDVEYVPSGSSDSEEPVKEEEDSQGELARDVPQSRKSKRPAKKPRGKTYRSPGKRTISLNSPSTVSLRSPRLPSGVHVDDEDEISLQKALALSMGSSLDVTSPREEAKGNLALKSPGNHSGTKTTQKRSKKSSKALNFTENEIDALFVSIVGSSEGRLSMRHLENAASAHDFTWTKEQLEDMIDVFDKDRDGQLNLAEFRSMAEFCKLIEAS